MRPRAISSFPLTCARASNQEAQLDQRTAEICLGEVGAAKGYPPPNFLILIGERYGWVPLPFAIACDEFEALVQWLNDHGQQQIARDLGTVYAHDANHRIPPDHAGPCSADAEQIGAYTLRSRADELPGLKDAERWIECEARLRHALQTAADVLLLHSRIGAEQHEKYFASLTEQEIARGLFGKGHCGERGSFSDAHAAQAIAVMREFAENTSLLPEVVARFVEQDAGRSRRLDRLKDQIKTVLPSASIITTKRVAGWSTGICIRQLRRIFALWDLTGEKEVIRLDTRHDGVPALVVSPDP